MNNRIKDLKFGQVMGLGDTIWLTAIFKACKGTTTYFHDNPRARLFSFLFDGLTEVRFDDSADINPLDFLHQNYGVLSDSDYRHWRNLDPTHVATKMFKTIGIKEDEFTIIPKINVSDECINLGLEILAKIGKVENPLILVGNNSGGIFTGENSQNWQAAHRALAPELTQKVINQLSKEYTILQCGKAGSVFEFDNVVRVYDLLAKYPNEIKALAGLYKIVGKYVGLDTGDAMLMLATGGEIKVLVPEPAPWYNGISSVFSEKEYKWEKVRSEYIKFGEYHRISEKNKLSF